MYCMLLANKCPVCIRPDIVAPPAMDNKKPGGLLGAGTEESDCVLEIRERDEKSSMAGPQQETLLEQHQGFRCHELQIQQSCRQKLSTHTFRFSAQIHTSVLRSTFVHKGWWIRSWPLMDDFLSLSYQSFFWVCLKVSSSNFKFTVSVFTESPEKATSSCKWWSQKIHVSEKVALLKPQTHWI